MDNDKHLEKFTPSALKAIEDITNEVTYTISKRAIEIAKSRRTAEEEISLRDLLEAKEQILDSKFQEEKSQYRRKRLALMILLGGIIYSLAGIVMYISKNKKFDINNDIGLVIFCVGVITMILGIAYIQLINRKQYLQDRVLSHDYSMDIKTDYDLVQRWQIIEKLTSIIMLEKGITENKAKSVNSIIEFLSNELVDDESKRNLKHLLQTRNKILHEFYKPTKNEKTELINFSNKVIEILENIRDSKINNY